LNCQIMVTFGASDIPHNSIDFDSPPIVDLIGLEFWPLCVCYLMFTVVLRYDLALVSRIRVGTLSR
jgi:hypothetical protein